jgi:hypothetical protein
MAGAAGEDAEELARRKAEATGRDEGLVVTVATEVVVLGGLLAEQEGPAPGAAEPEVLVRCVV